MNFKEKIVEKIQSGSACLYIQSDEILRLDQALVDVATTLSFKISEWNLEKGWVDFVTKRALLETNQQDFAYRLVEDLKLVPDLEKRIIILKNIDLVLDQTGVTIVALLNLIYRIQKHFSGNSCLILTSSQMDIHRNLKSAVSHLELPRMNRDELSIYTDELLALRKEYIHAEQRRQLLDATLGLTEQQVKQIVFKFCLEKNTINLFSEKKQLVQKQGLLELVETSISLSEIGGLENLKSWLDVKCKIFKRFDEAKKKNIPIPKGVLIAGMPGCGKSMTAKATAKMFDIPLLRLDLGRLLGKYVGQSESNLRQALQLAENVSPCVLWLDELEKAFASINSESSGSEVTSRMFGYFLTWLQENQSAVFVVATANNISALPPELLRKGPFDEIFAVDFPEKYERKNIFEILLKKHQVKSRIDVDQLVDKTENFAGSDLQAIINEALERNFITGQEITQQMLDHIVKEIQPLSIVLGDIIQEYREKFKKFKLKKASLTEQEYKKLDQDYHILSHEQKINLSMQFQITDSLMQKLAQEKTTAIIENLLKHDNCPESLINQILQQKIKRLQHLGHSWSNDFDFVLDESSFKNVCKHPKAKPNLLIDLYQQKRLSAQEMLNIVANRSDQESFKSIIQNRPAKLHPTLINYIVSDIMIEEKEYIENTRNLLILENNGGSQGLNLSKYLPVIITKIYAKKNQKLLAGEILFDYLYLI